MHSQGARPRTTTPETRSYVRPYCQHTPSYLSCSCAAAAGPTAPQGGTWRGGVRQYDVRCPAGTYIATNDILHDAAVRFIGPFVCVTGDGIASKLDVVVGGRGAKTTSLTSWKGNIAINVRAGQLIDAIQAVDPLKRVSAWIGGSGGQRKNPIACAGLDQRITGIHGLATDSNVVVIGIHCETFGVPFAVGR